MSRPLRFRQRPRHTLRSQVLILELDSVRQATRFASADSTGDAIREITGMIRTALLVSDRITVTDAMILDGIYFAHIPPLSLAQAIGVDVAELPIDVVVSHRTLALSLKARRDDPGFVWQIDRFLDQQRKQRHWDAWLDAEASLTRTRHKPLPELALPGDAWRESLSPAARELFNAVSGITQRSRVHKALAAATDQNPDDLSIARVFSWWDSAYLVAIAEANDADWLRFDAAEGLEHAPRWRHLSLTAEMKELASGLPAAMFGTARYLTAPQRQAVHEKPTGLRMRNLTYTLHRATSGESRTEALAGAGGRLALAVIAILAALPVLPVTLGGWNLAWVAFGGAALASIPFDAFAVLRDATRKDVAASLAIRSAGGGGAGYE